MLISTRRHMIQGRLIIVKFCHPSPQHSIQEWVCRSSIPISGFSGLSSLKKMSFYLSCDDPVRSTWKLFVARLGHPLIHPYTQKWTYTCPQQKKLGPMSPETEIKQSSISDFQDEVTLPSVLSYQTDYLTLSKVASSHEQSKS